MELVNKNNDYVDFETELAGNEDRGVLFRLTYIIEEGRFYGSIYDSGSDWEGEVSPFPDHTAKFMLGEDVYYNLKGKAITRKMANDLLDKAKELGHRTNGMSWPNDFDGVHHIKVERNLRNVED
jgi:hypothetical protein